MSVCNYKWQQVGLFTDMFTDMFTDIFFANFNASSLFVRPSSVLTCWMGNWSTIEFTTDMSYLIIGQIQSINHVFYWMFLVNFSYKHVFVIRDCCFRCSRKFTVSIRSLITKLRHMLCTFKVVNPVLVLHAPSLSCHSTAVHLFLEITQIIKEFCLPTAWRNMNAGQEELGMLPSTHYTCVVTS